MRSYWAFKALVQMAREQPYQVISNDLTDNKEAFGAAGDLLEKRKEERLRGGEKEDNEALSKQSKMRKLIGVSLW